MLFIESANFIHLPEWTQFFPCTIYFLMRHSKRDVQRYLSLFGDRPI